MSHQNSRREFLKTTAAAGVGFWVAGTAAAEDSKQSKSALDKINFACVGVGGKGASDSSDAGRHGNVVAICDIDDNTLEKKSKEFPQAKLFNDYRKMLDEMGKSIDAVTVSTPDHTHAPAAAMAMRMGKHCFCQKPMTHSIYEARKLAEIAREMKVATQMGNQGTAGSTLRRQAALIRAGAVGPVKEVHVWTNRPIWPQGQPRPEPAEPPAHVHWDLWLGPAPYRPYSKGYHPFAWRGWWDFGTGALGDMACHTMNMPFMALDLRDPISVEAETSGHDKDSYPKWSVIRYEFPATDKRPAVAMIWYDGGKKPSNELIGGELPKTGSLVIGEKGMLLSPGDYAGERHRMFGGAEEVEVSYPESPGHFTEWANAIKGGEPAMSNFPSYAGPLTETVLLGNLAVYAGKKVEWDAKTLKPKNAPEVEHIVRREYREGYTL
jgi:predicted dehydrogenase